MEDSKDTKIAEKFGKLEEMRSDILEHLFNIRAITKLSIEYAAEHSEKEEDADWYTVFTMLSKENEAAFSMAESMEDFLRENILKLKTNK